jgi:hypothetical protein
MQTTPEVKPGYLPYQALSDGVQRLEHHPLSVDENLTRPAAAENQSRIAQWILHERGARYGGLRKSKNVSRETFCLAGRFVYSSGLW